jgi:hypothetical protein
LFPLGLSIRHILLDAQLPGGAQRAFEKFLVGGGQPESAIENLKIS